MTGSELLAKHGVKLDRLDYLRRKRGLVVHGKRNNPLGPDKNLYDESDVLDLSVRKKRAIEQAKRVKTVKFDPIYSGLPFTEQVAKYREKGFGAYKIAKLTGRKIEEVLVELARGIK